VVGEEVAVEVMSSKYLHLYLYLLNLNNYNIIISILQHHFSSLSLLHPQFNTNRLLPSILYHSLSPMHI